MPVKKASALDELLDSEDDDKEIEMSGEKLISFIEKHVQICCKQQIKKAMAYCAEWKNKNLLKVEKIES